MAAGAIIAALAGGGSIAASAGSDLPDKTPQELLGLIEAHGAEGFSGTLESSLELGLPQLPGEMTGEGMTGTGTPATDRAAQGSAGQDPAGQDPASLDGRIAETLSMLSGTQRARIFVDGHDRSRVQLMDGADERNVIRNGDELWFYDSAQNRAVHATVPRHGPADGASLPRRHHDALPTPAQIADRLLERAEEHSVVSVEEGTSDSGRDAYTLRLDPRTEQTLVDAVSVDVDAQTGVPLGVEVRAVGQDEPAVSVAFTQFTPEAPDAGLFDFRPPAGATVEEKSLDGGHGVGWQDRPDWRNWHDRWDGLPDVMTRHGNLPPWAAGGGEHHPGEVIGEGWDAVVVVPADAVPRELTDSALLDELAVEVAGGRLLSTPLLTVLLTDDGRMLAGAVPQQRLLDVAAGAGRE